MTQCNRKQVLEVVWPSKYYLCVVNDIRAVLTVSQGINEAIWGSYEAKMICSFKTFAQFTSVLLQLSGYYT